MSDPLARLDEIAEAANRMYGAEWSHLPDGVTESSAVYIATFSPGLVKRLLAVARAVEPSTAFCPVCRSDQMIYGRSEVFHRNDCPWPALARRLDEEGL